MVIEGKTHSAVGGGAGLTIGECDGTRRCGKDRTVVGKWWLRIRESLVKVCVGARARV